jgi:hypothetical protein
MQIPPDYETQIRPPAEMRKRLFTAIISKSDAVGRSDAMQVENLRYGRLENLRYGVVRPASPSRHDALKLFGENAVSTFVLPRV